jgi:hypothetical protein
MICSDIYIDKNGIDDIWWYMVIYGKLMMDMWSIRTIRTWYVYAGAWCWSRSNLFLTRNATLMEGIPPFTVDSQRKSREYIYRIPPFYALETIISDGQRSCSFTKSMASCNTFFVIWGHHQYDIYMQYQNVIIIGIILHIHNIHTQHITYN